MAHHSRTTPLSAAIQRIAEALEAEGWPAAGSGPGTTLGDVERCREDLDRAAERLARVRADGERTPALAPWGAIAVACAAAAQRRLNLALARHREAQNEPSRPRSHDEALRQLRATGQERAFTATGDLIEERLDGKVAINSRRVEIPAWALDEGIARIERFGRNDQIAIPGGMFINVRLPAEDIDRLWPMPADRSPMTEWLQEQAEREASKKLKKDHAIGLCVTKFGATWLEALAAYRALPEEYRFKPHRPRK